MFGCYGRAWLLGPNLSSKILSTNWATKNFFFLLVCKNTENYHVLKILFFVKESLLRLPPAAGGGGLAVEVVGVRRRTVSST